MPVPRRRSPDARRRDRVAVLLVALAAGVAAILAATGGAAGEPADLVVTQTVSGTPVEGGTGSIQIRIANTGLGDATEVIAFGGVPIGSTLNAITPSQGACAKGRNSVFTCNFGVIPAGATVTASMSVGWGPAGTATGQVQSTSSSADANATDNVSRLTVAIGAGPADAQLSGRASGGSPSAGSTFQFAYRVKVGGKTSAVDTRLTSVIGNAAVLGASTSTGATCTVAGDLVGGFVVDCPLGTIPGGGGVDVTVDVLAPAAGTLVTSGANVSHTNPETNPTNDSVVVNVTTR